MMDFRVKKEPEYSAGSDGAFYDHNNKYNKQHCITFLPLYSSQWI